MTPQEILKTEYSERFDKIRQDMMVMSYYKYGPLFENYEKECTMDAIKNLELRLQKYKDTGNTEFLCDVANFAMIEFMCPQREGAFYQPTHPGACQNAGFGVNEIKNWSEENE